MEGTPSASGAPPAAAAGEPAEEALAPEDAAPAAELAVQKPQTKMQITSCLFYIGRRSSK
jgi:hypothetical protein